MNFNQVCFTPTLQPSAGPPANQARRSCSKLPRVPEVPSALLGENQPCWCLRSRPVSHRTLALFHWLSHQRGQEEPSEGGERGWRRGTVGSPFASSGRGRSLLGKCHSRSARPCLLRASCWVLHPSLFHVVRVLRGSRRRWAMHMPNVRERTHTLPARLVGHVMAHLCVHVTTLRGECVCAEVRTWRVTPKGPHVEVWSPGCDIGT